MTNSPNGGQEPPAPQRRRSPRLWRWAKWGLGAGVVVGGVAGGLWVRNFVRNDLVPLIETEASKLINRPVEVGDIESLSLTQVTFGPSALPATDDDRDRAELDQIRVNFNPLQVLTQRRLDLTVTLARPRIFLDQTEDGQWLALELPEGDDEDRDPPVEVALANLRLEDGEVTLAPSLTLMEEIGRPGVGSSDGARSLVTFSAINGNLALMDDYQFLAFDVATQPESGGDVQVEGEARLDEQRYQFTIQAEEFNGADLSSLIAVPVTLDSGRLFMNTTVAVEGDAITNLQGTARVEDGAAQIQDVPQPLQNAEVRARFRGQEIRLEEARVDYGSIPVTLEGLIDLEDGYDLSAQAENVTMTQVQEAAGVELPVPVQGAINLDVAVTGDIIEPDVRGRVATQGLLQVDRVGVDSASSEFFISVADQVLRLEDVRADLAAGGTLRGGGVVPLGTEEPLDLTLTIRNVAADAIANSYADLPANLRLGAADADITVGGTLQQVNAQVQWQALRGTYPARGEILVTGGDTLIRNTVVQVDSGQITADGAIANGQWQANVVASAVPLAPFSPQLRGVLDSRVQLGGSLDNPSLAGIRATGNAQLSEGVSVWDRPLSASFRWLGDRLALDQLTSPGLDASGTIFADTQGTPQISRFDLGVALQNFDLAALRPFLPDAVNLTGAASFAGRVGGDLEQPTVVGDARLANLAVNALTFEPVIAGPVDVAVGQRVSVDLRGQRDRIFAELDSRYYPTQFLVRQDAILAEGQTVGDRLSASLANFPIETLNLAPATNVGLGVVSGDLNGTVDVNLATLDTAGTFTVNTPGIGYITADQLSGQFRYADNLGRLTNGELRLADSRFLLSGRATLSDNPEFQGQIVADKGRVQDLLTAMQWFDLEDVARGLQAPTYSDPDALTTVPVGNPDDTLLNQLRRLAEIQALQDLQAEAEGQGIQLPDLTEFEGDFTGTITFAGSAQGGVTGDANLLGTEWRWGQYDIDRFIAQAELTEEGVTLLPLRVEINDDAFVNIAGQFGGEEQNGQFQAENIPLEPLLAIANLPIPFDISGTLDANALLEGSLDNPLARGLIEIENGTLNQQMLDDVRTAFSYTDARLNFIGEAGIPDAEPLRARGSIPYQLPFMAVVPDSDQISLTATVQDDGLRLLSLFTNQVAWEGGNGEIDVTVTGTLFEPRVTGTAVFSEGTISALALPEPLTNVTGRVTSNGSLINVVGLRGQFQQGEVVAQGVLPIFDTLAMPEQGGEELVQPLTVSLNQVRLNFKGLFRGGVNGNVVLEGNALAPLITGEIALENGQVELGGGGNAAPPEPPDPDAVTRPPRLDNLRIALGDRLRITLSPVLDFVAQGNLTLNGFTNDLRPEGEIRLRSGVVNLFTTRFGLVRGYNNVARFEPNRGLDPILDVRLVTSVPEVRRTPTPDSSPFAAAEISETLVTDIGAVGTVRVEARVDGPASQLSDNLELTSSPARSESEIISLLGGNVASNLGGGDGTLAIANIAGSALLNQVQNTISRALGITDFRLYPTVLPDDTGSSSNLELASEIGVNITGRFSTSVLAILTTDAPVQFNLRYRLTERLLMRGYIDTDGGSGAVLEFETRF